MTNADLRPAFSRRCLCRGSAHEDPHEGTGRIRHEHAVHEKARVRDRVRVRRERRAVRRRADGHRQRHGNRRVGSRLAALRASRVHIPLDGSGRGVLRSRHRAVRGECRGRDHPHGGRDRRRAGLRRRRRNRRHRRRADRRRLDARASGPSAPRRAMAPATYGPPVLSESFDGGVLPPGWSVQTESGASWIVAEGADPCGLFDGNRTGGSGPYAIVNSNCAFSFDDTYLVTPVVDLSGSANAAIRWANDFIASGFGDLGEVDVTIDGGATWTNVWKAPVAGLPGPGIQTADMSFAAGHAAVQARFHYQWFFGFWWQVDDVTIGPFSCPVLPGGLVVGNVRDANTGLGLNGATVTNLGDDSSAITVAAPGQGDGFYSLFAAGSGSQAFEATADLHTALTKNADVTADAVVRLDFSLAAGLLDAGPRPLSAIVSPGGTQTLTLDVTNTGTGDGSFVIHEVDVPPPPATEPVFASLEDQREARRAFPAAGFSGFGAKPLRPLPNAPIDAPQTAGAGNVVSSFEVDLVGAYGLAYDTERQPTLGHELLRGGVRSARRRRSRVPVPAGWHTDRRDHRHRQRLAGRRRLQRANRDDLATQRRLQHQFPSSMPRRDRSRCEGRHGQADLRSLDQLPGAYGSRLRLRHRHVLRRRPVRRHHSRGQRRKRPRLGQHRAPDLGPGVQPDHSDPVRRHVHDRAVRHLAGGPEQRLRRAQRLRRQEQRRSRAQHAWREPRVRLQWAPLGHARGRKAGLRGRVGRARMVHRRHPVALRGPGRGNDPRLGRGLEPDRSRQHAARVGDVRLGRLASGAVPPLPRLHDGHARPGRSRPGRPDGPLQRRAGRQLRLELHPRRGRRRRHAGLQPVRPGVRLLPDRKS